MPAFVSFTIQDAKRNQSVTHVNIPTITLAANAIAFAQSLGDLILGVITGAMVAVGVGYEVALTAAMQNSLPADPNSDVEEGARFGFVTSGNHPTSFRLATFDEAMFLAGTTEVDLADPAVDALVDAIVAGLTVNATLVQPTDSRNEDITALESAVEQFTKSRR